MLNQCKIIGLLLFLWAFSPVFGQKYYDEQWKKVAENYQKGVFKNNLPIIKEIQTQAMKDDNAIQLIRSLKAEFSIINETRDDTKNDLNSQFFKQINALEEKLNGEEKWVYKVLLGEFFQDYYTQNQWRINQRTNVLLDQSTATGNELKDIEVWSKLDFKTYLAKHYADLDANKAELQKISLPKYKDIFEQTQDLEYFPTLYDWHALQKIKYLQETGFFTKNELAQNEPIIKSIYDELITKNTGNPKLYFQHQQLKSECEKKKCKDYVQQLISLYNSNTEGEYKVMIGYDIAEKLEQEKKYTEAIAWGEKAIGAYPKSPFVYNIKNLLERIKQPTLGIKYETHTQSNLPIHIVAEARNVNQFYLNIYEVNEDYKSFLTFVNDTWDKSTIEKLKKNLVRRDLFLLQDKKDYQAFKTALEVKPLPSGIYFVEYMVENVIQDKFYFVVTQSRFIFEDKNEQQPSKNILKLVNRETGKEIPKEGIVIYEIPNQKDLTKNNSVTDAKGNVVFPNLQTKYYRQYLVHQPQTNDFNLLYAYGDQYYNHSTGPNYAKQAQIFLDRAIYRPGQLVYFKVISTQLNENKESVLANDKQKIVLLDVNYQEVASQTFTTNQYGSYHGSFTLPSGKLNGRFHIRVQENGIYATKEFLVEEYKRPSFEVTFEPIKSEYKFGDKIELKGKAVMFSGVPLTNAKVNYEIKKRNIRWMYFWWYPRGNDNENSILGEVQTNEKGEFSIVLDLKKDETIEGIQVDNYEINASVMDVNGETQFGNTQLKVASVSHYIKLSREGGEENTNYFTDESVQLKVETKNYNEQNLKKSYQVKLSKLEEPPLVLRNNFQSEIQNRPNLSKEEFHKKFPHDRYDESETQPKYKKTLVFERTESQEKLDLGKLPAGKYILEVFNIEGKDTIATQKELEVWSKTKLEPHQKPFLKAMLSQSKYKRSETALLYVYSAIPNAIARLYIQNGDGKTQKMEKSFQNGIAIFTIPLPKDERILRLQADVQVVAYNDVQTESLSIEIEQTKKPLRIETLTFRDKLQPNQKEKWSVKILGDQNEKVNAEVLANMYDQSLDQFAVNTYQWQNLYYPTYIFNSYGIEESLAQQHFAKRLAYYNGKYIQVPTFNWFDGGFSYGGGLKRTYHAKDASAVAAPMAVMATEEMRAGDEPKSAMRNQAGQKAQKLDEVEVLKKKEDLSNIKVRQNLNETAFFYPNLLTDKDGNINFEFTSPEALTQWKLMFLAHTKDARSAMLEKSVVTQKEFSVTPNYPRFLREGDEIQLQSRVSNLTSESLNTTTNLQILDAFTNEDISSKFNLVNAVQEMSLVGNGTSVVNWKLKVPNNVSSIIIKVVAKGGQYSDGEQKAIAVLPNRMLVTDAVPIFVKEGQTKSFSIENLIKNTSTTVGNVSNTLELTTNPIWEILFALPSLKNDTNNSADVIFNKWFADVLASEIFKANPKMKTVFDEYQSKGLLSSNLEKNQELKQLLLEETPWVLDAKDEQEQMQKLARIFDANTMRNSIQNDWNELQKLQNPDGGFSWHAGYPSSYWTSLYILKNLGRINEWLKGNTADYQSSAQKEMVSKLVQFVDREVNRYWNNYPATVQRKEIWSNWAMDYLDTRHYWEKQHPLSGVGKTIKELVIKEAKTAKITDFTFFGLHRSAMLFDYYGLKDVSTKLMTYLKETSTETETQGVYWKKNVNDWGWYNSNVINHAGALEAFNKLTPMDQNFIEEIKIWLVTQKEVNSWGSSRGTAEVIYTILNSGKSWTSTESDQATIVWGGKELKNPDTKATGYVKTAVKSDVLDKNLGTVTVTKPGAGIVQGGLFWQYYEDLDKIKSSESYISITKELYKKVKTVNGELLEKITENSPLKVGDKVTVRMILNTDRPMEFIHLKDMRAAGFEPLQVLSGYQWKNNLGYYQSTKDASTNFYIEYMPKGKYVFEYDYISNASGKFSNGFTTLQNYYAPQMNAHTQGTKVVIESK